MASESRAGRAAITAGIAAAVGLGAWLLLRPIDVAKTGDEQNPTSELSGNGPAVEAGLTSDIGTNPVATPEPPNHEVSVSPQLDVVRIDAAGSAIVAGVGAGHADVVLRLDGEEVAAVRADANGNFVSLFDLGTAETPRILTLESSDASGAVSRARDRIIVAPTFPHPPAVTQRPVIAGSAEAGDEVVARIEAGKGTEPTVTTIPVRTENALEPGAATRMTESVPSRSATLVTETPGDPASIPTRGRPTVAPRITSTAGDTAKAPRLFRAGPDGVSLIATSGEVPRVRQNLGIDAITYDAEGEVSLAGTGAGDSELRIYLDNEPVRLVQVDPAGTWSSPLPDVESGVYTLRIDEVTADGTVESRVETPFQLTAPEVAAASRRDGITAITVQPGFTLWAISEGYFGEGIRYVQIFENNRDQIRNPDLIFPGQVFNLPEAD